MSQIPPSSPMQPNYQMPAAGGKTSGLAIAAMIIGIASIFPGCCATQYGMLILGIVAVVLGVMARGQITRGERRGSGLVLTGIITGAIGLLLGVFFIILALTMPDLQQKLMNWRNQLQQQQQRQTAPASQVLAPSGQVTVVFDKPVTERRSSFASVS